MFLTHDKLKQARDIMSNPTTFGTVAAGLCMQLTEDEDSIHWDPAVLDDALSQILGDRYVDSDVLQRINAVSVLLGQTGMFFSDPAVFHAVCATLLDPDTDPMPAGTPPEPVEMAWSCAEAILLLGEAYSDDLFFPEVCRYCGVALHSQGITVPPSTLKFADFPEEVFPDPDKYADEMIASSWLDAQEEARDEIDGQLSALLKEYRKQLQSLQPFGGDSDAYRRLGLSA